MTDYAAFISYSHRYRDWVEALHHNLSLCLDGEVFLDDENLDAGRSWIGQLQEGISRARYFILVATPEALASHWVTREWQSCLARPDWQDGKLQIIQLIPTPLPPFLGIHQYVDFHQHDEKTYREKFRRLLKGMGRRLEDLPANLVVPEAPSHGIEPRLREDLLKALTPLTKTKVCRTSFCSHLNLPKSSLEDLGSPECTASALLERAVKDGRAIDGALLVIHAAFEDEMVDGEDRQALEDLQRRLQDERAKAKPADDLLRQWLDQVADDHKRLIPLAEEQTGEELLEQVYVKVSLKLGERIGARHLEASSASGDGTLSLPELLELDPESCPEITHRWVVRGDPGAGKTTLLRHLTSKLAREDSPPWVPIFESLPRLIREPEFLLDRIERRSRRSGPGRGLAALLDDLGREGKLLLLLDGLDEVPREHRSEAEELLRDLARRWPDSPLVVSTRPIGYRRPAMDFLEVDVESLDEAKQETFLAKWFGRRHGQPDLDRARTALRSFRDVPSLRDLAANPLYLTLMALLLEDDKKLDQNRPHLYDQVFKLLLAGRHRPNHEELEPIPRQPLVRQVLCFLAFSMTLENRDGAPLGDLENQLYSEPAESLHKQLERVVDWRRSLEIFFRDVSEKTGILGPYDGEHADWRYWHRTFREALASEELSARYDQPEGEAAILEHARSIKGDESRWAEPYALLTGRLQKPDELVRALMKENRALGLRALATAQTLQDETVAEVLELSGAWNERVKVYGQLPELVDDPERLLPLLDRLRQRTRNGNDLFHLDLAFGEVARRWSDAATWAETLRSRLFAHIPPPDEDLFRWIETPKDGRVELWKPIPSGSFLMGSPEDEEERRDNEGPQYRVGIESSFALAAVPITNAQFSTFDDGKKPRKWEEVSENELPYHPAVYITWYEATMFCRWLSQAFPWAEGARLPSEEEWEYACRARTSSRYWSGDAEKDLDGVGWYDGNSENRTHRVGEKDANPWGLYDVHGNVWEWTCTEWDAEAYSERAAGFSVDPRSDLAAPSASPSAARVIRGGSFWYRAWYARSAYRFWNEPGDWDEDLGFRVLLPVPPS